MLQKILVSGQIQKGQKVPIQNIQVQENNDKIKAEVLQSGEVSVSAVTFFEIIKRLPSGSEVLMIMEEGENEIRLTCGRSKFSLSTLKTDDFPIISDSDLSTNFVLSADELIRIIDKTKFAVSNCINKESLN